MTHPWPWRGCLSVMRHSRPTVKDSLFTLHQLGQCTLMGGRVRRACSRGKGMEDRLPHTSRTRTYNENKKIPQNCFIKQEVKVNLCDCSQPTESLCSLDLHCFGSCNSCVLLVWSNSTRLVDLLLIQRGFSLPFAIQRLGKVSKVYFLLLI